jgi:hypothetical protein
VPEAPHYDDSKYIGPDRWETEYGQVKCESILAYIARVKAGKAGEFLRWWSQHGLVNERWQEGLRRWELNEFGDALPPAGRGMLAFEVSMQRKGRFEREATRKDPPRKHVPAQQRLDAFLGGIEKVAEEKAMPLPPRKTAGLQLDSGSYEAETYGGDDYE